MLAVGVGVGLGDGLGVVDGEGDVDGDGVVDGLGTGCWGIVLGRTGIRLSEVRGGLIGWSDLAHEKRIVSGSAKLIIKRIVVASGLFLSQPGSQVIMQKDCQAA